VSAVQAKRELGVAGFDDARESAKARALLSALAHGGKPADGDADPAAEPTAWVTKAGPTRSASLSPRWPLLLAAVLGAAATGGVLYALGHRSKPVDKPVELPREEPTGQAPGPGAIPSGSQRVPVAPSPSPGQSFKP